jgi:hypothetical protein
MNIADQLKRPTLDQEPFFYINSDYLKENIDFIKENNIKNIYLQQRENGYNLKNVNFLKEMPFIEKLAILVSPQIDNVEAFSCLENLTQLQLTKNDKLKVDLSSMSNLKNLFFGYTKNIKGLEKLNNIEKIYVDSGTDDFFNIEIFKNYTKLNELRVSTSIISNSLSFLKENTNLESLTFSYMKRAFDLEGILYLKNSLKKLSLTSSKKIDNVQLISQLVNLETLGFIESVTIESAALLKPLTKLEAFGTYGSSYFVDGDLRSLKHLKDTIKHFKVQDKKHYIYE